MKVITLNLHLWHEENQINKLKKIANFIIENDIDICFFQEVAQLETNKILIDNIKEDNNAYLIKTYLNKEYYLYFEYKKNGYEVYNEGLAILSKYPLINKDWFYISKIRDHKNWHTRIIVKASINYNNEIIDLYCGTGSIGLYMAGSVKSVLGVEIVPDAIENAKSNAKKNKIAIVPDHFTPNKDIKAAEQCKFIREFSREKEITKITPDI